MDHRALCYISVTVTVLIVVLVCLACRKKQEIETFALSHQQKHHHIDTAPLENTFGQAGCRALDPAGNKNVTVLAQQNANAYLNTGRFRQWKPFPTDAPADLNNSSTAYCYVNNDIEQNEQDYYMSGHTCTITDPNFKNIPFITDVFQDANAETTSTTKNKKCVFKIDKTSITPETINRFWNEMSAPNECLRQFSYLIELNQSLSDQKKAIQEQNAQLVADIARQDDVIEQQDTSIRTKKEAKAALQVKYKSLSDILQKAIDQNSDIDKAILAAETACSESMDRVNTSLAACVAASNQLLSVYTPLAGQLNQLHRDMASFQIRYDGLNNDLAINKNLQQQAQNYYNTKYSAYGVLQNNYSACQSNLGVCNQNYTMCQSNLATDTAYKTEMKSNYDACKPDLDECNGALSTCYATSNDLKSSITKYRDLTSKCINKKNACLTDDAQAQVMIKTLGQEFIFVQEYYNYTDCDAFKQQVNALSAQEADLLARCKRIQDTSDRAFSDLQTAAANQTNAMQTDLKACQTNVSGIRSPPVKAPTAVATSPQDLGTLAFGQSISPTDISWMIDGHGSDLTWHVSNNPYKISASINGSTLNVTHNLKFGSTQDGGNVYVQLDITATNSAGKATVSCFVRAEQQKYYHYALAFHWTNAQNGGSAAFAEGISSISAADAQAKLTKVCNPNTTPWNGNWRNQGSMDINLVYGNGGTFSKQAGQSAYNEYAWTNQNNNYELQYHYNYGANTTWIVQIGGPTETTARAGLM